MSFPTNNLDLFLFKDFIWEYQRTPEGTLRFAKLTALRPMNDLSA